MIRVLIADDEEKVCKLIRALVDWDEFDMEIVGFAHNGIEALEKIRETKPELVITDIRMPGYDGLEMIGRAKKIDDGLHFIIISGHRHFEYAQQAIQYGVSDYLLKPIKKDELKMTLAKVREERQKSMAKMSADEAMQTYLQNNIDHLQAGFFERLIAGEESRGLSIEQVNYNYHFRLAEGLFQGFIVKIDCDLKQMNLDSLKVFREKMMQTLNANVAPVCYELLLYEKDSRIYGIANYAEGGAETTRKKIKEALDHFLILKDIYDGIQVSIGLGKVIMDIGEFSRSAKAAENALKQRLILGTGQVFEEGDLEGEIADNAGALLSEWSRDAGMALDILDEELLQKALDQLYRVFEEGQNKNGKVLFSLIESAFDVYLMRLRLLQFIDGKTEEIKQDFMRRADLCGSAKELYTLLNEICMQMLEKIVNDKKQMEKKPVRIAKQYISSNYTHPITLEEVAEEVGFNASYFSTLFKKESGQNFNEYLLELRMNKAKELLKESQESVANICQSVGYSDLKHFTQLFKKQTGLKPNEYRKLYS